jgi:uncharacterized cofD-like protein
MRRWVNRFSLTRWLRIGMGVKRWVLLLIGGILMLCLAVAILEQLVAPETWLIFVAVLYPAFIGPVVAAIFYLVAGCIAIGVGVYRLNHSLLVATRRHDQVEVVDMVYRHRVRQRGPKVVAIGGGHGLNTLLRGLKEYTDNITAIVTVADDGGSSGRLRRDLGILPPGDFRNCIAALSDAEGLVTQLFQYRFGHDSDLDGHSFGNLYLSAMTAITGSFEAALTESSRVLAVRGRVFPSTLAQVNLSADVGLPAAASAEGDDAGRRNDGEMWQRIRGESAITAAHGRVRRVYLEPDDAPAYPDAIRAILAADLIVAGPGSLFTSVLPNLLVRDLAMAIAAAWGLKVYVCNVATEVGETQGYDVSAHVRALRQHVGMDLFSVVLANNTFIGPAPPGSGVQWVRPPEPEPKDYRLVARDLVDRQYPWRHDPNKLAHALMELINT